MMTNGLMELNINYQLTKLEVREVALLTQRMADQALQKLEKSAYVELWAFLGMLLLFTVFCWKYGAILMQPT